MAPKRSSHLDDPPAASSSEEAEEASSEEEEEEEEDASDEEASEAEKEESPKQAPTSASKPADSDSDEEDSGSDEEDAAVKPLASKPPEEPATPADKPKRARSKVAATPTKRPAESQPSKTSKRAKKKDSGDDAAASEDEPKKSGGGDEKKLFQRVWSEEDEIVVLKGMVDYIAKNGSLPSADMGAFHDFIKKSLKIDFTKVQLTDKIRRLKRKFETNKKKKVEPSKPIEKKAFDLSKKIWAESSAAEELKPNGTPVKTASKSASKSNGKNLLSSPEPAKETEKMEIDGNCGGSGVEIAGFDKSLPEYIVKQGLDLVPADKKAELKAKWKEIHMAEFELYLKRTQLMSEQGKLILEALKSSD